MELGWRIVRVEAPGFRRRARSLLGAQQATAGRDDLKDLPVAARCADRLFQMAQTFDQVRRRGIAFVKPCLHQGCHHSFEPVEGPALRG